MLVCRRYVFSSFRVSSRLASCPVCRSFFACGLLRFFFFWSDRRPLDEPPPVVRGPYNKFGTSTPAPCCRPSLARIVPQTGGRSCRLRLCIAIPRGLGALTYHLSVLRYPTNTAHRAVRQSGTLPGSGNRVPGVPEPELCEDTPHPSHSAVRGQ